MRVCNEIYNKHRTALRLIFENVNVDSSIESEIVCETLRELGDAGEILFTEGNGWIFFTAAMDEYLPALAAPESSWGTHWVYYYWLEKAGDTLVIHLELGGWNLTEALTKRMNALIAAANKKAGEYRYRRLYRKTAKLSPEDYETSLRDATRYLVKSALENEKELLAAAKGRREAKSALPDTPSLQ